MGLKDLFKKKEIEKGTTFNAYITGRIIPIEEVKDDMFANKILGEGVAIEPTDNVVVSPVDGKISMITEDSLHACGIEVGGLELLIHIGIDTVGMNGDGFVCHINVGDTVKKGDKLITFDMDKIKSQNLEATTMLVIVENNDNEDIEFIKNVDVVAGETKISV